MIDRVSERLQRRIDSVSAVDQLDATERRALAVALLEELLPLDDVRRTEVTVWVEFSAAARTDPALAALAHESTAGTRALISRLLTRMVRAGGLADNLDVDSETKRLTSLVDGLSLNAVLHPDLLSADDCMAALHAHLDRLQAAGQPTTATDPLTAPTSDRSDDTRS